MRGALPRGRALHGTRLMPDVDVLVVGAGPAGAVAAREAKCAAPELDVALLERDPAPGTPVRCAEGVGDAGLREFADPDSASWVARKITRVILVAPDDTEVKVEGRDVGWILDRTRFDAFLADEAGRAGAAVLVESEAAGMSRETDGMWHVRVRNPRGEQMFRARIVIGADGVEAMVGRWAGREDRLQRRWSDRACDDPGNLHRRRAGGRGRRAHDQSPLGRRDRERHEGRAARGPHRRGGAPRGRPQRAPARPVSLRLDGPAGP